MKIICGLIIIWSLFLWTLFFAFVSISSSDKFLIRIYEIFSLFFCFYYHFLFSHQFTYLLGIILSHLICASSVLFSAVSIWLSITTEISELCNYIKLQNSFSWLVYVFLEVPLSSFTNHFCYILFFLLYFISDFILLFFPHGGEGDKRNLFGITIRRSPSKDDFFFLSSHL